MWLAPGQAVRASSDASFRIGRSVAKLASVTADVNALVATGSAVLTTLLGVVAGAYVGGRSHRLQRSWDRQADACAQVLTESAAILVALARVAKSPTEDRLGRRLAPLERRPRHDQPRG
jgi:ubiquinone biosynthesis protein UbiJ